MIRSQWLVIMGYFFYSTNVIAKMTICGHLEHKDVTDAGLCLHEKAVFIRMTSA